MEFYDDNEVAFMVDGVFVPDIFDSYAVDVVYGNCIKEVDIWRIDASVYNVFW